MRHEVSQRNYINSLHILRIRWDAGGDIIHTDEHTFHGVYAELYDGELGGIEL